MSALGTEVDSPEIVFISHAGIPWKYLDRKRVDCCHLEMTECTYQLRSSQYQTELLSLLRFPCVPTNFSKCSPIRDVVSPLNPENVINSRVGADGYTDSSKLK